MKKLLSIILACAMFASMSTTAFATKIKNNPNTDGKPNIAIETEKTNSNNRSSLTETEQNNNRTNADLISIGDTMTGTMGSTSDIDCYKLIPTKSQEVTITLDGPSSSSYDYDLWLQNNSGNELARSAATGSDEEITYNVSSGTTYYIVVNTASGSGKSYTLTVTGNSSSSSSNALGVTRYAQERSNWCWAAVVQMIGKFETGVKTAQSSIVTYIHGSVVNSTGDMIDQVNALQYIDSDVFADADYWSAGTSTYFERYVTTNFQKGHATSLACTPASGLGHSYVVDEVSGNYVTLIDPYGNEANIRVTKTALLEDGVYSPALTANVTAAACVVY